MPKATLVFTSRRLNRSRIRVFTADKAKRSAIKFIDKVMLAAKASKKEYLFN